MKLKNGMLQVWSGSTDHSIQAYKYGVADETFSIQTNIAGSIDIGYRKCFRNLYLEINTPNTAASKITVQYHDGSAWIDCDSIDETKGLKKSGFIYIGDAIEAAQAISLHGESQVWIKLVISVANTSAVVFGGINNTFCSNDDINSSLGKIKNFAPVRGGTHIVAIKAARDEIVRRIRNSEMPYHKSINPINGAYTYVPTNEFTALDIFDNDELRDAAVPYANFHTLSREQSDDTDDVYRQQGIDFHDDFERRLDLYFGRRLTRDMNDDGKKTDNEIDNSVQTIRSIY